MLNGIVDESVNKVLTHTELQVFDAQHPLPTNAVMGDAEVMALLERK